MTEVVIAAYRRSPFHFAGKGDLAKARPDEMAATVARAWSRRRHRPAAIEDIIVGCAFPEGEQGLNVARLIGFLAGLPQGAGAVTVNRFCGSSMQAVHQAAARSGSARATRSCAPASRA
jgi:acetyl-CoA acyltransferase